MACRPALVSRLDKSDASAGAIMSIGAVKGFEIGDGFAAAKASAPRIMTNFMSMLMVSSQ